MSLAGISSTSALNQLENFYQQRQSGLQQLGQSLQSGNLAGAQSAFTALTALSGSGASGGPFRNSQLTQDFSAIGQALQSGNLAGAQQAFATFQQDLQTIQAGQQAQSQVSQNSASNSTPEIILNLSNSGGSEEITINFGANSGASSPAASAASPTAVNPPQVSFEPGGTNSNGPLEEVTINIANSGNSNSLELQINFSGASQLQAAPNLNLIA